MVYMGYEITRERDHIRVTAPNGAQWTEDTVADAKQEIRESWMLGTAAKPQVTLRDKLELMDEIELRNQQRINDYIKGLAR